VRKFIALTGKPYGCQQLAHAQVGVFLGFAAEAEGDVFFHAQMWKQRVILKDHANSPLFRRHALPWPADNMPMQADLATGNFLKAGNAAQQGCFAATGWAEQTGNLPRFKAQIDAIDDGGFSVALNNAI
jgi:hypothetical protein